MNITIGCQKKYQISMYATLTLILSGRKGCPSVCRMQDNENAQIKAAHCVADVLGQPGPYIPAHGRCRREEVDVFEVKTAM